MWKLKTFFWTIVMFLLVLMPNALGLGEIDQKLNDTLILSVTGDVDQVKDNSSYGNDGTVDAGTWFTSNTVFMVGDKSTTNVAGGTGSITFSNIPQYTSVLNWTACIDINATLGATESIFGYFTASGNNPRWQLKVDGATKLQFNYNTVGNDHDLSVNLDNYAQHSGSPTDICIAFNVSNLDTDAISVDIYINGTWNGSSSATKGSASTRQAHEFYLGYVDNSVATAGAKGMYDGAHIFNTTLTSVEIKHRFELIKNGTTLLNKGPPPQQPTFFEHSINNTIPIIDENISVSVNITDDDGLSGYVFQWDGGTGVFVNDSFVDVNNVLTINASVNRSIEVVAGTNITYRWWANDTINNEAFSGNFSFIVAGTTAPNLTINGNNFFQGDNKSIISFNQSNKVLINFTLTDDVELLGIRVNISNISSDFIANFTNTSFTGTIFNFSRFINVSNAQGFKNVSIELVDTHTAIKISDFKVYKGLNFLKFDNQITISANNAIWSNTRKLGDRYSFEFNYLPIFTPKTKVFYIESNSKLIYIKESKYKAHFVDFKNEKWIDFEGIKGEPIVTKINDHKYKIQFNNADSKVIFNSIGGLNKNIFRYQFYISDAEISFHKPSSTPNTFLDEIFVSINVTGNGRNRTIIKLFNSSDDLFDNISIVNNGTGTYFYNTTFTNLPDHTYKINATHIDVNKENVSTTVTLEFNKLIITNDSTFGAFPAINFTIKDESNSSRIRIGMTATGTFIYNTSTGGKTYNLSEVNKDNFSVFIFPARESIHSDYVITYSSTGYQERVFTVTDAILTNSTELKNLFLLADTEGIFGTFRVVDAFGDPLTNVKVTMKLTDDTIIEIRNTDDGGVVSFFVDPDTTYKFTFEKAGFDTETFSLRITSTNIITVTLEGEAVEEAISFAVGVDYFFLPRDQVLLNNTNYDMVFNLTSSFWNITGCSFRIRNESEVLNKSKDTFNGSACAITIPNFNTGNQSLIISEAEYQLNNTFNVTVSTQYSIIWTFKGEFSLKVFLDDIKNFSEAGFNDFTRFIIAVLVTFLIVGILSSEMATFREPEILIAVTWVLVLFFSYLNWMNIPLDTIPNIRGLPTNWLKQWIVFILFSLGGGSYVIKKHA